MGGCAQGILVCLGVVLVLTIVGSLFGSLGTVEILVILALGIAAGGAMSYLRRPS